MMGVPQPKTPEENIKTQYGSVGQAQKGCTIEEAINLENRIT